MSSPGDAEGGRRERRRTRRHAAGSGAAHDLSRLLVVLDHPKDVVNIAGVVRVMMNFGLTGLRLVRPDEFDGYRIGGIAHRSQAWTERAELFDTLEEAVADATFIVGTTARARTAGRAYARPRDVAREVAARLEEAGPAPRAGAPGGAAPHTVAILFGREDRGLTNEALDLCHAVAIIPTHPEYPSLNLAQACLVLAYEVFLAAEGDTEDLPRGRRATRPPTRAELEETFAAIEQGLARIEFYKGRKPEAVMRTLRTLVARAEPDLREARLLAAIGYEIGHHIDRITGE